MKDIKEILGFFKNTQGDPLILKPGEIEIFKTIVQRKYKRNAIRCYTRYGKSMTVALGALVRAILYSETWVIIAPTKDKTNVIMRQIITHLFDHPFFYSQLEIDQSLERLKRERRKDHLTFRRGGQIFTLTANASNQRKIGGALLGEGSANVIQDEAPLIPDRTNAFVMRMLHDSSDNFLVKIGNAFENNHFKRACNSEKYHQVVVDCYQGVEESKDLPYSEGKFTEEMIEEGREQPFFEELYECKFPDISMANDRGYRALVTTSEILASFDRFDKLEEKDYRGEAKIGLDPARGGDYSAYWVRYDNCAWRLQRNRSSDLMTQVPIMEDYYEEFTKDGVKPREFVDTIGVGSGIADRLREKDIPVIDVVAGATPEDKEKFKNVKAENYWLLAKWIKGGGAIKRDDDFLKQMEEIRYKEDSERKVKIEPKEDYVKRMTHSPDDAEALMLTFTPIEPIPEFVLI